MKTGTPQPPKKPMKPLNPNLAKVYHELIIDWDCTDELDIL